MRDDGFTLIELMVVVVLLGILIGFVLLGVAPFQSASKVAACESEIDSLRTADAAHRAVNNGEGADDIDDLDEYLERTPRFATFDDLSAPGACATRYGSDDGLALTPDVGVTEITGTAAPPGASEVRWGTQLTVTVQESDGAPAVGAVIVGTWSDGTNPDGCETTSDGTCTFGTLHDATDATVQWDVVSVDGQTGDNVVGTITCTGPPTFSCS